MIMKTCKVDEYGTKLQSIAVENVRDVYVDAIGRIYMVQYDTTSKILVYGPEYLKPLSGSRTLARTTLVKPIKIIELQLTKYRPRKMLFFLDSQQLQTQGKE
jgi:hypothetical protein